MQKMRLVQGLSDGYKSEAGFRRTQPFLQGQGLAGFTLRSTTVKYSKWQRKALRMSDDIADFIKSAGGIQGGDVLLIPAGTYFDIPVYQGRNTYTFAQEMRVRVLSVNYNHYQVQFPDEIPHHQVIYFLPKYTSEPGYTVPDWRKFKIE
jgi:hypothetical protein